MSPRCEHFWVGSLEMSRRCELCVVALKAESISLGEMIKLQELSTPISVVLREWQDKETLVWLEDHIWNEMNEEWAEFLYGEGNSQPYKSGLAVKQAWALCG